MDLYPKPPSLNPPSEKEKWPEGFVTEDELLQKATTIDQLNAVKGTGWNGETVKGISDQLITHLADYVNPHRVTATQVGAIVSVDGVSNAGGNIDLVAGAGISITPDNVNKQIIIAASPPGLVIPLIGPDIQYETTTVGSGYTNTIVNVRSNSNSIGTLTVNLRDFKIYWQSALAGGKSVYFEAIARTASAGYTAYVGLRNVTNEQSIVSLSTTSNTFVRLRSGPLTIPDLKELCVTLETDNNTSSAILTAARLVIV